jgi:multiple sugar transport system substrate-binding protein
MPITIALAGPFSDQVLNVLDQQINAFEAENPDIRVAVLRTPRGEARRREAFAEELRTGGDTSADIYALDPHWLPEFYAEGWLVPLDDYVERYGLKMEDFFPPAAEASSLDGRLVALPFLLDGGLLYFRQDLLSRYGYEAPLDWRQLQEAALAIKEGEGLPAGLVWQGAPYESLTCNALEYIWAYGGQVLDVRGSPIFDTVETRAGLQQMVDLVESGASPPTVASYTERETLDDFQAGNAALMRHWASVWPYLEGSESLPVDQIGIAPLPASCLGGLQLALSTHSLYPEQASRFMAFLVSPAQQVQLALGANQLPALNTVYQDARLLAEKPTLARLRDALDPARQRPRSPVYAQISEAIYTEVNTMLLGTQDAAATAANIQRRLEASVR